MFCFQCEQTAGCKAGLRDDVNNLDIAFRLN